MYSSTLPFTSALDGGGWSTRRLGHFTPWKDPVPIVQEAGWAPGPVWTGVENLAHSSIRCPDRPARSESLYRLSYLGPAITLRHQNKINDFGVSSCWFQKGWIPLQKWQCLKSGIKGVLLPYPICSITKVRNLTFLQRCWKSSGTLRRACW